MNGDRGRDRDRDRDRIGIKVLHVCMDEASLLLRV